MLEVDLRRAVLCDAGSTIAPDVGSGPWSFPNCDGQCLAHLLGWRGMYVTPLQDSRRRWRTPTRGDLGHGWLDLTLIHPTQRRVIFAELKSDAGTVRSEQAIVGAFLIGAGQETYVWRPVDLDDGTIYRILRDKP